MKIFVNFVTILNTGAYLERTREVDIDRDEDEIATSLVCFEIAEKLGLDINQAHPINIYTHYENPLLTAEAQGLSGKLSLLQLQTNNPLKKFSLRIPSETYNRLDTLLDQAPQPRERKKKVTNVWLSFMLRVGDARYIEERYPFEIENEDNKEEISELELKELLAKKFDVPAKTFSIPLYKPGAVAKLLGGKDEQISLKDFADKNSANAKPIPIIINDDNLWPKIGSILLSPSKKNEKATVLEHQFDRRSWVQKLGLPNPGAKSERNAGMEPKVPLPSSPKPVRLLADSSKEAFARNLQKLRARLDACQPPIYSSKVSQAAENIYQQVNTKINNNVNFATLSDDEIKDYFRLVDLVGDVLKDFPEACKAENDISSKVPDNDTFDRRLVELKCIAKRVEGARSIGKIIAGVIIAFVAVLSLGALAFGAVMSAGLLSIPHAIPAYLSLSMFSVGVKLVAAGFGLSAAGGAGVAVAVSGRKKGIADAVDSFPDVVREERNGYRSVHVETMQHLSKFKLA